MPADDPEQRWRPSRAGILNVYQYQDEVLEFAGGRLLLRGVNGSGKSTAMNMLLPFLLEADVRKIDAAGEQRGVLRSWMLSDHDDTQRTGYLWIEFERCAAGGDTEYRTVGCGIRANRSTDRVATWWFSTDRRVRIDLRLTEADVPFSVDVLRSELGTRGQVFTSTAEYRAEIARRFFGGVDPGAYFRLLHQVRNPRVGDRIDTDLPRTLREALPPVPEDAVHDAAQPLEDLEDHRRNVTDLARTAEALDGAVETYTDYARRVLAAAVDDTAGTVDAARTAARRLERDRGGVEKATAAQATRRDGGGRPHRRPRRGDRGARRPRGAARVHRARRPRAPPRRGRPGRRPHRDPRRPPHPCPRPRHRRRLGRGRRPRSARLRPGRGGRRAAGGRRRGARRVRPVDRRDAPGPADAGHRAAARRGGRDHRRRAAGPRWTTSPPTSRAP